MARGARMVGAMTKSVNGRGNPLTRRSSRGAPFRTYRQKRNVTGNLGTVRKTVQRFP